MLYQRCNAFLNALASEKPVPGGGGACALVAAEGVALGEMVANLTIGKEKYADIEDEMKGLLNNLTSIRIRLQSMVNNDAKAFAPLKVAYSMPSSTDEEKEAKAKVMEECLYDAAMSPFKIGEAAVDALGIMSKVAEIGNKMAISDVATGVGFIMSAARGAYLNVIINTRLMKNEKTRDLFDSNSKMWYEDAEKIGNMIIDEILNTMVSYDGN